MATSKGQFVWHEYTTTDVKAALAFYGHVVGWTSKPLPSEGGGTYHVLEAGGRGMGGMFEISKGQNSAGMAQGWVGYISSPDVDADATRLKKAGGQVHRPPADIPNIGRFAPVSDPQGAGFILFNPKPPPGEPPPQATGLGAVGWDELYATDWKKAFAFYSEMFGWKKGDAMDMGAMGTYQLFTTGAAPVGGMMNRADPAVPPHWLYYFNVEGIDAALKRVKDRRGEVQHGPTEVPGGSWIIQCRDPQGGIFALVAPKR
jgi:predicted enzyme related to lactoylglutathione lyase